MGDDKIIDQQDPLPESNFFWRRLFTFVLITGLLGLIYLNTQDIAELALATKSEAAIERLAQITRLLIYLVFVAVLCYMIAPSAEQAGRWVAIVKSGLPLGSRQPVPEDRDAPPQPGAGANPDREVSHSEVSSQAVSAEPVDVAPRSKG